MTDLNVHTLDTSLESLLDRILSGARDIKSKAESGELQTHARAMLAEGEERLADTFNIPDDPQSRADFRNKAKIGAGAGALALLLASRSRRKRSALPGLAALGALAFAAYKANGDKLPTTKDEVIGLLRGEPAHMRSTALLTAMVAAAQVDGDLSSEERDLIIAEAGDGRETLEAILSERPSVSTVVALADSPQAAREIYAVSARIADGLNAAERDYLDRLAMGLDLDPDTAAKIETEVRV